MSHEIVDNMLAWKNEVPWHGLGVQVDSEATGEEMLIAAGLNWPVERRNVAIQSAKINGKDPYWMATPAKGYKGIVRGDTNELFHIPTTKFQPVQNLEIVNFFKEYCEAGHAKVETVGGLKGGRIVWCLARLNGGSNGNIGSKLGVEDKTEGFMLLATSHDGSIRTIGKATQVRVVCWNTLSAAIGEYLSQRGRKHKFTQKQLAEMGVFVMKHVKKFTPEVRAEAQKIMGMAIVQMQRTNELAEQLSQVKIDEQGRIEFVKRLMSGESILQQMVNDAPSSLAEGKSLLDQAVEDAEYKMGRLGKSILEAIVNSPGSELATAKDTMWGVVNGVTYFSDHERGKSQDQRMYGSWFGPGNTLKNDAVKLAVDMSGITVAA